MASRYWRVGTSMGYVGTDSVDIIDACDWLNISEDEISKMKDSEVEEILTQEAYREACERVDAWAEPNSESHD